MSENISAKEIQKAERQNDTILSVKVEQRKIYKIHCEVRVVDSCGDSVSVAESSCRRSKESTWSLLLLRRVASSTPPQRMIVSIGV